MSFLPPPPPIPYATRPRWSPPQIVVKACAPQPTFKNAVYYPNWRVYRGDTPATLNLSNISHVFYAFAHVGTDGSVNLSDVWADKQIPVDGTTGCMDSFHCLKKRHHHLKLILSIGGGGASQNFPFMASNTTTRENFARSAKSLIDASGFDGIDIDWEHPSDLEQGRNFLALLAAVRSKLPSDRYLLTAALPAGEWALKNIDLFRAQKYLDMVNVMAYDFSGPWSSRSGHHAQLYSGASNEASGASAVEYMISKRFPPGKILLGIPAYGRSFLCANGPGQKYNGTGGEEGTFEYKHLPRPNCREFVDTKVVAASCIGADGGFVSYDNPDTVRAKAIFCREKALAGLFYWTGTADATPGLRSLILTGFKALQGQ